MFSWPCNSFFEVMNWSYFYTNKCYSPQNPSYASEILKSENDWPIRRSSDCPEIGTWGLYNEFGLIYDQNHSINEICSHKNIGLHNLIDISRAKVSVLCS